MDYEIAIALVTAAMGLIYTATQFSKVQEARVECREALRRAYEKLGQRDELGERRDQGLLETSVSFTMASN
ncbi:MAG: hypothetical protein ABIH92_01395 [Nanoarchaeota archaeon]